MMENQHEQTIIQLGAERIQKYVNFLHEFEELTTRGEKKFISQLLRIHGVSAPTITVMRDIGLISGSGHKGFKINYTTPSEPILARRVLVALYHYNKLSMEERKNRPFGKASPHYIKERNTEARNKLNEVMNKYADKKLEEKTIITQDSRNRVITVKPESTTTDSSKKYKGTIDLTPKYRKKSKLKPEIIEVRSFGILWYKRIKTETTLKVIVCWVPIYHKKFSVR